MADGNFTVSSSTPGVLTQVRGEISESNGDVSIIRASGEQVSATKGTPIYLNDTLSSRSDSIMAAYFGETGVFVIGQNQQVPLTAEFFQNIDSLEQVTSSNSMALLDSDIDIKALEQAIRSDQSIKKLLEPTAAGEEVRTEKSDSESFFMFFERTGDSIIPVSGFETSFFSQALVNPINQIRDLESNVQVNEAAPIVVPPVKTILSLSGSSAANEGGQITYTATITNAGDSDLTVNLNNGAVITITAGLLAGSVNVAAPSDDALLDSSTIIEGVASVSGGDFESLSIDTTDISTSIDDTIDITAVTISDLVVDEGSGTAQVSASVDNAPETNLTLTLSNGATVLILAGQATGTSSAFAVQGNDAFLDGSVETLTITGTSGGNFEQLDTGDTALVTIEDTVDIRVIDLSVSDDAMTEDESGTLQYTVTLKNELGAAVSADADIEVTITLPDGGSQVVTILEGATNATTTMGYLVSAGSDALAEVDVSLTANASITDGASLYEDLSMGTNSVTTMVSDSIDATTVTLSAPSSVDEDGSITFTATLNNEATSPVTVTLDNAAVITIAANSSVGTVSVALTANSTLDISASIANATGGNFESLVVDTSSVEITVNAVTGLTATDDTNAVNEDTLISGSVTDNASTTSGGQLSYALASGSDVSNGNLSFNADGSYDYTPNANFVGEDSFDYTVTDAASGESLTQSVTINVSAVTDLTATDDSVTGNEDTLISGSVADNASTTSGGELSYALASGSDVSSGSVTFNADGSYDYTPNANFVGEDSFDYTVTDAASGESLTQSVTISVSAVTDLTATDDSSVGNEDTLISGSVADNASTNSGGELSYAQATNPASGSVTFNVDGSYDYTPNANFAGEDSFDYTVTDAASGETSTQSVTLTITGTNDVPVLDGLTVLVSEDFESGAVGWSDNTTTNTDGDATNFLGQFVGSNGDEAVFKVFELGADHAGETINIKFDMYEIDSWDSEFFKVFVNGDEVASDKLAWQGQGDVDDGGTRLESFSNQSWGVESHSYEVQATVDVDGNVRLGFGSTLNQGLIDESYGIDNLVITSTPSTGNVTELITALGDLTDSGSIGFTDVDITDTHTATVTAISTTPLGTLISIVDADAGTIDWDYSVDASAVEYLAAGETKVETFTITLDDDNGGLVDRTVSVTITGTNDAPTMTTATGTTQVENNGATTNTQVATFTASDMDGDDITYSITSGNPDGYFEIVDDTSGVVTLTASGAAALADDALADVTYTLGVTSNDGTVNSAETTANIVFEGVEETFVTTTASSNINGTGTQTINLSSFGVAIGATVSVSNLFARGDINGDYSNESFSLSFVNADGEGTNTELTGLQTPLNNGAEDDTFREVTSPIDVTVTVVDIGDGMPGFVVQGMTENGVDNIGGVNGVDYYFDIVGGAVNYVVITGDVSNNTVIETDADYDDDMVIIGGKLDGTVSMGAGNDRLTIGGKVKKNGEISTDTGDDTVIIGGKLDGTVSMGAGNDRLTIGGKVKKNGEISTDTGDDTVIIGSKFDGTVSMGAGNDTLIISSDIEKNGEISTDAGDDKVTIGGDVKKSGDISTDTGDDTVIIGGKLDGTVSMGADNDTLTIGGDVEKNAEISTDAGDDKVIIGGDVKKSGDISTDAGDDTVTIGGKLDGTVSMGAGNDTLTIGGDVKKNASIDMGEGTDTLVLSGYSSDDVDVNNLDFSVAGAEFIHFGEDNVTYQLDAASGQYALTATVIDGIVEGLNYVTSSGLEGFTAADGSFNYVAGDTVVFSIGNLVIGDVDMASIGDGQVFLQDIADVDRSDMNDEYVENMAVLLQSLDHNGDAYDGIEITAAMRDAFSQQGFDLATISSEDLNALIEVTGRQVVSEDEAMVHVEDMLLAYTDLEAGDMDDRVADSVINSVDTAGNDQLSGQGAKDTLSVNEGNDILFGAEGEDILSSGTDLHNHIYHTEDSGHTDTIKDFDMSDVSAGGDVLNFADFLSHEEGEDITEFLHVHLVGTDTVITVDADGTHADDHADITVVLEGVDLTAGYVDTGGLGVDQAALLQNLIDGDHLIVDSM